MKNSSLGKVLLTFLLKCLQKFHLNKTMKWIKILKQLFSTGNQFLIIWMLKLLRHLCLMITYLKSARSIFNSSSRTNMKGTT